MVMTVNPDSTAAAVAKAAAALDSTCSQCGDDSDYLTAFSQHKVCGKCTYKNYRKAVRHGA